MSDEVSYPLHEAAASGDIDTLNRLLSEGADVEGHDSDGHTPLIRAARGNQLAAVRHLLKWGARIESSTSLGMTALSFAASRGYLEMAGLLLSQGADPNFRVPPKPVEITEEKRERPRKLRGVGSNAVISDLEIEDSGSIASSAPSPLVCAIMHGHEQVVSLLLASGANPNPPTSRLGTLPLQSAVQGTNAKIVHLLLERGADVDAKSGTDFTALQLAAMRKSCSMAKILLEAGANPNTGNMPPLGFAVNHRDVDMIRLLLAFGADPEHVRRRSGT